MAAERLLMWLLIGAVALGCALVLYPFSSAIVWAAILVYSSWPVFLWLRRHLGVGSLIAAVLMVLIATLVLAVPLALALPGSSADVARWRIAIHNTLAAGLPAAPVWLSDIPIVGRLIRETWNGWAADLRVMERFFHPYIGLIAESGLSLLLSVAGGVMNILVALFISFFLWWGGEPVSETLEALLRRIAGDRAERLLRVTKMTVRGVVYGMLGTALVQGFLTAFGLWVAGVPRAALLGAIAAALAVLPIGAPLVWIPATIWLLVIHHTASGIFLGIYGGVVVSGADHLLRPYFISRGAKLPFLLIVLGVLGGALKFGFLGVFLGPVLLGLGYSLVMEFAGPAGLPLIPPQPPEPR